MARTRRHEELAPAPRRRSADQLRLGRRGIGARELSRSILHDATGSVALAERLCRDFTHEVIADLPDVGFELDREQVLSWLDSRRAAA